MNPTNPTTLSQGPAWRSRAAAAALLALATNLSAQSGQVTAPVESSASGSIWRAGQNRVQCIYDSTLFTGQGVARAVLIDRLRWRSAAGVFGAATSYPAVDIWPGDSAADVLAPSTSFDSNPTAGHTLV